MLIGVYGIYVRYCGLLVFSLGFVLCDEGDLWTDLFGV